MWWATDLHAYVRMYVHTYVCVHVCVCTHVCVYEWSVVVQDCGSVRCKGEGGLLASVSVPTTAFSAWL